MSDKRKVQVACDRCTQGVMDATNPHLRGLCQCPCHTVKDEGVRDVISGVADHFGISDAEARDILVDACEDTPTPAASAGPDFEAAHKVATKLAPAVTVGSLTPGAVAELNNLARAYLAFRRAPQEIASVAYSADEVAALRSLPRDGEAPVGRDHFQRCPACDGKGVEPAYGTAQMQPCNVCKGARVLRVAYESTSRVASPLPAPETGRTSDPQSVDAESTQEARDYLARQRQTNAAPPLPAGRPEEARKEAFVVGWLTRNLLRLKAGERVPDAVAMAEADFAEWATDKGFAAASDAALPAGRGSEVSEEMARRAAKKGAELWGEDANAYEEFWDDIKDEWIAIVEAALGRGSEGA